MNLGHMPLHKILYKVHAKDNPLYNIFIKNVPFLASFLIIFGLFQQTIFTTK